VRRHPCAVGEFREDFTVGSHSSVDGDASGRPPKGILFDAYGTLFDVYSLASLAEELFPQQGATLAVLWREKQLDYSRLRTLCDRYVDFLTITKDALLHACARLRLDLSEDRCQRLLEQYLRLPAYPEVLPALERLRAHGMPLAILSNGSPEMLTSAISAAGMSGLFAHVLSAGRRSISLASKRSIVPRQISSSFRQTAGMPVARRGSGIGRFG
jgi:2-haloalkanoic acid dehalogenase type II